VVPLSYHYWASVFYLSVQSSDLVQGLVCPFLCDLCIGICFCLLRHRGLVPLWCSIYFSSSVSGCYCLCGAGQVYHFILNSLGLIITTEVDFGIV
jgi:hypothetical protein